MNILYVTTHLNIGGITSYILTLAKGFKKRGHAVYIASSGGECLPKFTDEGIVHIPIPIRTKSEAHLVKLGLSLVRLKQQVREKDIQLIHSHTRVTQVLCTLLASRAHIPHITTCHGFFRNRMFRRLYPCWGDRVIAISDSVKFHLIDDFGLKESMVRLVYSGIDLDRFIIPAASVQRDKYSLKRALGLGGGPVVGAIGRLSDVKGYRYLVEAMPAVLKCVPQAQLLIVGDGREYSHLARLAARLGIEKKVTFITKVYDTVKALSVIDVFAMPSLKEGLGLSLMEAMAAGLPCVGSDIGGIRNLITHRENGLLVEAKNSPRLGEALVEVIEDEKLAQRLGDTARTFINHNFSQAEMLFRTEEVYRECLNNGRG
ncbi:MAG TPA: glycosyltransferase family 4 protein [Candidatus Omnitrophota bacterium]|nr:glycosyltransferase family 4 protein [Candidatus Omnitrophota bacterium]HRZ14590.1 glycosyltransferase family 4 protein [Candidatus Omnitrophota bacterium]